MKTALGLQRLNMYILALSVGAFVGVSSSRGQLARDSVGPVLTYTGLSVLVAVLTYLLLPCLIDGGCTRFASFFVALVHASMLSLMMILASA